MNLFSRRIFAYALVVLTGCAHFQGATPLRNETYTISATTSQGTQETLSQVRWNLARSGDDFYHTYAFKNRVIVALFGAESCDPCHMAKQWWEENETPSPLPFVYWEDKNISNPNFEPYEAGEHGAGMYAVFHRTAKEEAYPFCSIMQGAASRAPFTQVVKWSGRGYEECTVGLQQALANMH